MRYQGQLKKLYETVNIVDNDDEDVAVDACGYTGNFYRASDSKHLKPYSSHQLIKLMTKNNKIFDIMKSIKDIDKEHNGYVTGTELDDILKLTYKEELSDKNLKEVLRPHASILNKILIDYKSFRNMLLKGIEEQKIKNEEKLQELVKHTRRQS